MVAEINAAQLPNELRDVQIAAQVPPLHGLLNQSRQQSPPLAFHFEDLVPHRARDVVELEESGRHRAPSRQARPPRPAEPVRDQRLQPRQSLFGLHRRSHHARGGEFRGVLEQFDLHFFLGLEMGEQSALGHANLIRQHAQRHARESRLAHQRQSLLQNPFARRCRRLCHEP